MSGTPRSGHNGTAPLPSWTQLTPLLPGVVNTMRRYLRQLDCILRERSVVNTDISLRSFAGFLAERHPEVGAVAAVGRAHIEEYKPWLLARPGQKTPRLMPATITHRLGTLRMFFVRISEWGWDEAPPRIPILLGDLPRLDRPLPKALDDPAAAKLLAAARADRKPLVRVSVEVLLRTGLRVGEYTTLPADAVVNIGAGAWLHVPVGKLGEDRYLEYFAVTEKVESLYATGQPLPANLLGPRMARLRRDHFRLLGNGYCTRPVEMDCAFEAICENCSFFRTGLQFRPILQRQYDDAVAKDQASRLQTFARLLATIDRNVS